MSTQEQFPGPEGWVRRDTPPHRGRLLMLLAGSSALLSALACLVLPGVVALPLAVVALWMARHDLREIKLGRMDPHGLRPTLAAQTWAELAVILGLVSAPAVALIVALL